jgi:hypothetical protein
MIVRSTDVVDYDDLPEDERELLDKHRADKRPKPGYVCVSGVVELPDGEKIPFLFRLREEQARARLQAMEREANRDRSPVRHSTHPLYRRRTMLREGE